MGTATMLDHYEVSHDGSKVRLAERQWKPTSERCHEPTPGEARAFWLEEEVESLKNTLANMVQGNAFQNFQSSDYWNGRFHRSDNEGNLKSSSGFNYPVEPADVGPVDPVCSTRSGF